MNNEKFAKSIQTLIQKEMSIIKTCYDCVVKEIDGSRVSVQINVGKSEEFEYPLIRDVPIMALMGGDAVISMPISVGDRGLLFFSTKALRQLKDDVRTYKNRWDVDDCFYFGGIFKQQSDGVNNNTLKISKGSDIIELSGSEINITTSTANINADTVNLAGGGMGVARMGDPVSVVIDSGSSAGTYAGTITAGSTKVKSG